MKIFPEQRKKTIQSLVILLISVAGVIYFNFYYNRVPPQVFPPDKLAAMAENASPAGAKAADKAPAPVRKGTGVLPYGSKIDLRILETDKFKALRTYQKLIVRPDELGKDNPFAK